MKSPRTTQIVIIAGIVLLVGFLFSQDIKGLVKPKDDATVGMPQEAATPGVSLAEASATAKNLISNAAAKEFTSLESAFQKAQGEEKANQAKVLAQKWDDLEQAIPSALYLEEVAKEQSSLQNWVKAGDRFLKAFDNTQDSLVKPAMLQKANQAFTKAVAIDSTDLDAKTGMGITVVNGMGAPMEGIAMLLDVVKKDPKNFKANMNLGLFAIKSGQFDKAITRFEDLIKNIKATPDAYFYLATAYENLGKNQEAIDAYLQSKKLAANPTLSGFIDKKVAELKK
ncbi:tetratricopeptide repeat protein [Pedobacter chitinilyticus]|uniref:Tetratricopeptide repeat protein n=1 Tax=Pedobacter chitinilyticus TaxID=2233776 RepID=A0A443YUS5_9SPHI|nr:tetratricopeptide repeat protein [Pedobacter chitinilyticus]RWU07585.1 tetratricopeptide repeat protein [Pedobacter chitinilyticus]